MVTIAEALIIGMRHQQSGQLAQAEHVYRQILQVEPRNAHALHHLGVLAMTAGQLQAAIELLETAVRFDPSQAGFHVNLGEAYRRQGNLDRAIACNRQAIAVDPAFIAAHANLGMLHREQGNLAEAISCFRMAVHHGPHDAQACALLAQALLDHNDLPEAEASFRHAVELAPYEPRTRRALGTVLKAQGKLDEAAACFQSVLAVAPRDADAYHSLGAILHEQKELRGAETHYRRAIESNPGLLLAYCNLAAVLTHLGEQDEAMDVARRAIDVDPNFAVAHGALGVALQTIGRLDEAMPHHRKAVELLPDDAALHSNLLYLMNYDAAYDAAAAFDEHRAWGKRHADVITANSAPHVTDRSLSRRLRVGYVSGHFNGHAVNFFTEPILASHDHTQFEIFCYSNVAHVDATTERLRSYADAWRNIVGLTNERTAELVRQDKIDILVDLAGHIGGNRVLVFAYKPAPIQVTYLGYQNTTGMTAMDYRLTDDYSDPPGTTDSFYSEKLVRLPVSFFCYLPSFYAPPIGRSLVEITGYVTFGSFNNFTKVTPDVLNASAEILSRVPNSRLILLGPTTASLVKRVSSIFESHKVSTDRIEFAAGRPRPGYLELIGRADIALDPFPFNGHTTTCDALWQGVPVITLSGNSYVSRFGGSALATLGLEELIAGNVDEYVRIAVELARDPQRLQTFQATLRQRMSQSPLLDHIGFTRRLEAAYRTMWTTWCAQQAPS